MAFVHSATLVNLAVFNANGGVMGFTGVPLWQGDGEPPVGEYAEWMPYQKQVAAGVIPAVLHAQPAPLEANGTFPGTDHPQESST